ncbi:MAG: hypothetical protein JSV26_06775 [bacterium]|nr:MAG: hypothetical protein JSV26_06775 [bacterium]
MKIEKFSFGIIRIDGRDYGSDVLLLPPVVKDTWWRREGHTVLTDDLVDVLVYRPTVLVVGKGASGHMRVPDSTIREVESTGTRVESYLTEEACRRFNELVEKGEKVAGAMHLTC